jgi:hypothetical protein
MTAERYVPIEALRRAVRGHEAPAVLWGDPTKAPHLILCKVSTGQRLSPWLDRLESGFTKSRCALFWCVAGSCDLRDG